MKKLTMSNEDYLEAIVILEKEGNIKLTKIAEMLKVSKPAANKAMNLLEEKGFITKEIYGNIILTEKGKLAGNKIYKKHLAIKEFLTSIGVSSETAEIDGCKIEHIISEETFKSILKYLENNKESN
ncbi:MAG: metal-dependent transcriptional regulator [Bacilli bacterium]|nr:metal-dependent transcriptional regulator [Bacilli bacterium]